MIFYRAETRNRSLKILSDISDDCGVNKNNQKKVSTSKAFCNYKPDTYNIHGKDI